MRDESDGAWVVEGPTIGPQAAPGATPLVVEIDRVVLGVSVGGDLASARLLTFRDGAVANDPWVPHDLDDLDARQAVAGRRLLRRCEDRSGRPFTPTSTWHVSTYGP